MKKIAKIILYDNKKRVLIQLREQKPGIDFPGTWSLIGGYIEENEAPENAVIRETKEEINFTPKQIKLLSRKIRMEDGIKFEENIYFTKLTKPISELQLKEGAELKLISKDQIKEYNIRPCFKEALYKFFEKI
jgi:8-oxo-dGTP diphosphatase